MISSWKSLMRLKNCSLMILQFHALLFRLIEMLLRLCICYELCFYSQKFLRFCINCFLNKLYATNSITIFVNEKKIVRTDFKGYLCQYQSNMHIKLAYFYQLIKNSILSFWQTYDSINLWIWCIYEFQCFTVHFSIKQLTNTNICTSHLTIY